MAAAPHAYPNQTDDDENDRAQQDPDRSPEDHAELGDGRVRVGSEVSDLASHESANDSAYQSESHGQRDPVRALMRVKVCACHAPLPGIHHAPRYGIDQARPTRLVR